MNTTYVISGMALALGLLSPGLAAIERQTRGELSAQDERKGERERFIERMDSELEDIDERLGVLRAEAKEKGREGRQRLQRRVDLLEKRRQRADRRLQELRAATGRAFAEVREHVGDLIEDLREDVSDTEEKSGARPAP